MPPSKSKIKTAPGNLYLRYGCPGGRQFIISVILPVGTPTTEPKSVFRQSYNVYLVTTTLYMKFVKVARKINSDIESLAICSSMFSDVYYPLQ